MGDDQGSSNGLVAGDSARFAGDSDAQDVAALLSAAVKAISDESARTVTARTTPLFFPNGIELIQLEFHVGDKIDITIRISGERCCKDGDTSKAAETGERLMLEDERAAAEAA
jgi:hypothetical protein